MKRPDFFIVGAPKCGTTTMYEYLRQHPAVFIPFHKEPLYFGDDLTRRYGRMTEAQYLKLFKPARHEQRAGEASSWYLFSRTAAREIQAFSRDAQIIVMLRNPVDMMYAQHSQLLFNGQEHIVDFGEALDTESERKQGRLLGSGPLRPENLLYRDSAKFVEQVQRYLDVFGDERVHVILFEDLVRDPAAVFRSTCRFLGIDEDVPVLLRQHNANRRVRSARLQKLVFSPPVFVLRLVPFLRQFAVTHALRAIVLHLNSEATPRKPMDLGLRRQLLSEFTPGIRQLETILDRDLGCWISSTV